MAVKKSIDITDKVKALPGTEDVLSATVSYSCYEAIDDMERYRIYREDTLELDHSALALTFQNGAGINISCSEWAAITFSSKNKKSAV